MKELVKAEVHDSEIVCLEYSKPPSGVNLLATASRDRLIHVLDAEEDYALLQTLDEHSSSITSVRFAAAGDGKLRIISCGADKSVYVRTAHRTVRGTEFKRTHHVVRKATPNDMDVDPTCKYAAVGCQDRSIRVINISSGKHKRSFSGSQTEDGSLLKVQIDPSGLFVASSCSDKNISLIDFQTGESLASVFGHSEIITALRFSSDCRRLLSSSADSCIFVWRLAPELTINMRERLSAIRRRHSTSSSRNNPFRSTSIMTCSSESDREEEEDDEDMKTPEQTEGQQDFSQRTEDSVDEQTGASDEAHWNPVKDPSADSSASAVASRPRRRWSCRVGSLELMVKSMLELRQLDSLSEAPVRNRSCADRLRDEDRCSTSSLQDWSLRRPRDSAWLVPAGAPEPEGVVLYPDQCPSTNSLSGPSYQIQAPSETIEHEERAEESQSPVSGASMGYGSGGSSPDHRRHDVEPLSSDDESCDGNSRPICDSEGAPHEDVWKRSSETLTDGSDAGSQMRAEGSVSACLHSQKCSSRTDSVFPHQSVRSSAVKPTVGGVGPLMEDAGEPELHAQRRVPQRSHPYLIRASCPVSGTAAGLQKSASAHSLSTDRRSLTPSHLRRERRPFLPKLSLEMDARHPSVTAPSSPQPWDSPTQSRVLRSSHSYMSPTASSMAKICRSASIGDGLHLGGGSCESLSIPAPSSPSCEKSASFLTNAHKALPSKAVRPRVCQRLSGSFAECPSRSASSQNLHADPSTSSSSSTDLQQTASHAERPRAAVKAFSVASDARDDQGLQRRRSSSVILASLPLLLSLPHLSGLLPLCFSPFFSLSSSRPGVSEIITALRFSSDCRRLLSSSADSCIFVWRLAPELTINMRERLSAIRRRHSTSSSRNNPFRSTSIMTCSSESDREEEEDDEDMKTPEQTEGQQDFSQRTEDSVDEQTGASDEAHWNPVKDPSADSSASAVASRPRRRWSCRVGSLELMVKSMLELRQLDSLSEAPVRNRSCADRLRDEDRCSTSSLQDWSLRRPRDSAWLVPAGAPEPEGVVLYPDQCPSTNSLSGPSYQIQAPSETIEHEERAEESQSPVSGASMGYGSGGSSPDHRRHDVEPLSSDDESCDGNSRPICDSEGAPHEDVWKRSSETLTDGSDAGSQMRAEGSVSACLHSQKCSSRTDSVFPHQSVRSSAVKPTVGGVGPLMEDAGEPELHAQRRVPQRSHPYLIRASCPVSGTAAGLQKSASAHSLSTDRRSLTPSHLRRERRPFLPKLSLEMDARHPSVTAPSSPQPWDSPTQSRVLRSSHSYMSPTASSMAKICRSASIGDGLHLGGGSCESLSIPAPSSPSCEKSASFLTNAHKALPSKAVRPRVCQRLSGSFAECPSRSASSQNLHADPSTSSSSSTDLQQTASHAERPRAAVKAFSVASDARDDQGLQRRRSSSVILASLPLLLSLPHLSGLLPLCFSPFFSLSSSRPGVSDASVSLEVCRRAAADLCSSVRTATRLYRTLISHDAERSAEQQQMCQLMSDALLHVRAELDSVSGSSGAVRMEEGKETLALLEQYSQLLLRAVERRLHQDT
ncbi:mitogen-activated kinase-binding 1-like isoform X1 [Labeo rohita]|uniref:Mitogen-activated kinase-binding 1-like isoform X1 n=1 Tax=Labeo rohita TaxID=84645 RepID=A0A498NS94_LABRO|nr:mitogen-activated kinase-binding 1-like isoform X1 [Labeo rohita]